MASLLTVAAEAAERPLLDAATIGEWEFVTPERTVAAADVCTARDDGTLRCAGTPTGFLATKASYRDYRLRIEWRWPEKPGNSGVLVHVVSGPKDRAWPVSFQVQTKFKNVGDLLPMAGASFAEALTSAPGTTAVKAHVAADSERAPGEWNVADITCRGDAIVVTINGVEQNRVSGCSASAGRIGLQFEGAPFELRAVRIEEMAPTR